MDERESVAHVFAEALNGRSAPSRTVRLTGKAYGAVPLKRSEGENSVSRAKYQIHLPIRFRWRAFCSE